jgi:uncharacterized tellurite resistance protein B-like protein
MVTILRDSPIARKLLTPRRPNSSRIAPLDHSNSHGNIQRSKILAVTLAFAVSAADKKLYNCEIELIKNWAKNNIDFAGTPRKAKRRLDKALNKTIDFFRSGNQLDIHNICREIVEIVPVAERYDILNLCLRVVKANGLAAEEELTLLKNLAEWLQVNTDRFR